MQWFEAFQVYAASRRWPAGLSGRASTACAEALRRKLTVEGPARLPCAIQEAAFDAAISFCRSPNASCVDRTAWRALFTQIHEALPRSAISYPSAPLDLLRVGPAPTNLADSTALLMTVSRTLQAQPHCRRIGLAQTALEVNRQVQAAAAQQSTAANVSSYYAALTRALIVSGSTDAVDAVDSLPFAYRHFARLVIPLLRKSKAAALRDETAIVAAIDAFKALPEHRPLLSVAVRLARRSRGGWAASAELLRERKLDAAPIAQGIMMLAGDPSRQWIAALAAFSNISSPGKVSVDVAATGMWCCKYLEHNGLEHASRLLMSRLSPHFPSVASEAVIASLLNMRDEHSGRLTIQALQWDHAASVLRASLPPEGVHPRTVLHLRSFARRRLASAIGTLVLTGKLREVLHQSSVTPEQIQWLIRALRSAGIRRIGRAVFDADRCVVGPDALSRITEIQAAVSTNTAVLRRHVSCVVDRTLVAGGPFTEKTAIEVLQFVRNVRYGLKIRLRGATIQRIRESGLLQSWKSLGLSTSASDELLERCKKFVVRSEERARLSNAASLGAALRMTAPVAVGIMRAGLLGGSRKEARRAASLLVGALVAAKNGDHHHNASCNVLRDAHGLLFREVCARPETASFFVREFLPCVACVATQGMFSRSTPGTPRDCSATLVQWAFARWNASSESCGYCARALSRRDLQRLKTIQARALPPLAKAVARLLRPSPHREPPAVLLRRYPHLALFVDDALLVLRVHSAVVSRHRAARRHFIEAAAQWEQLQPALGQPSHSEGRTTAWEKAIAMVRAAGQRVTVLDTAVALCAVPPSARWLISATLAGPHCGADGISGECLVVLASLLREDCRSWASRCRAAKQLAKLLCLDAQQNNRGNSGTLWTGYTAACHIGRHSLAGKSVEACRAPVLAALCCIPIDSVSALRRLWGGFCSSPSTSKSSSTRPMPPIASVRGLELLQQAELPLTHRVSVSDPRCR